MEESRGLFGRPRQLSHGKLVAAAPWPGRLRKTRRDRKPQMRTEAVYVALRIPDCAQCACVHDSQRPNARGSGTGAVHADTWKDHMTPASPFFSHLSSPSARRVTGTAVRLKVARRHAEKIWLLFLRSDVNAWARNSCFHCRDTFDMDRDQTDFSNRFSSVMRGSV